MDLETSGSHGKKITSWERRWTQIRTKGQEIYRVESGVEATDKVQDSGYHSGGHEGLEDIFLWVVAWEYFGNGRLNITRIYGDSHYIHISLKEEEKGKRRWRRNRRRKGKSPNSSSKLRHSMKTISKVSPGSYGWCDMCSLSFASLFPASRPIAFYLAGLVLP